MKTASVSQGEGLGQEIITVPVVADGNLLAKVVVTHVEDVPLQALREQPAQVVGVWGRGQNDNFSLSVERNQPHH